MGIVALISLGIHDQIRGPRRSSIFAGKQQVPFLFLKNWSPWVVEYLGHYFFLNEVVTLRLVEYFLDFVDFLRTRPFLYHPVVNEEIFSILLFFTILCCSNCAKKAILDPSWVIAPGCF